MDERYIELERVVVAGCIGELDKHAALAEACRAVGQRFGVSCRFAPGHRSDVAPDEIARHVGRPGESGLGTLVFASSPRLEEATLDRIARLFDHLVTATDPYPAWSTENHRLRNLLAGLVTNVEFVELLVQESTGELDEEQRRQVLEGLAHARRSGRALVEMVRSG